MRGKAFVKLMEALVESAVMYWAEVVGRYRWLDCIDQVQLRAYRIFQGVSRYIQLYFYKLSWVAPFKVGS